MPHRVLDDPGVQSRRAFRFVAANADRSDDPEIVARPQPTVFRRHVQSMTEFGCGRTRDPAMQSRRFRPRAATKC